MIDDKQRKLLLRGALYSLKINHNSKPNLVNIASWILLEDRVGDKEFSFHLALTIPSACEHYDVVSRTIGLYDDHNAKMRLVRIRTSYFVLGARSLQTGREVV